MKAAETKKITLLHLRYYHEEGTCYIMSSKYTLFTLIKKLMWHMNPTYISAHCNIDKAIYSVVVTNK